MIDDRIKEDKKFWQSKYNLTERRRKMERALFGREIQEKERNNELKKYEARYSDNAIYEIESTLKPVAMSHLPDMIVSPGNETSDSEESAEDISKAINDDLKKRECRRALGLGFKHLPVYFTAVLKARWNPEKDDYEFYIVHPDNIILPRFATSNDADQMDMIPELLTLTVQDVIMRFPDKKEELFKALQDLGKVSGKEDFNWKDLASEIKIWEVWFTWYTKSKTTNAQGLSIEEPGNKWEKVEGVLWKFEDIILKKMKNPNFDYEGQTKFFTYDDPSNEQTKREVKPQEMMMSLITGVPPANTQEEQVYFNYFKAPKKPYFFFGYDQWGKVAIDETSRIEQNISNQDNLNTQGKQIIDTLKARVKHIWSTDTGLSGEDVQNMDMDNPKLDALVDGNVNDVHKSIQPERPDAAQFNALNMMRTNMFGLAGATALTGQIQSQVATTNQIAREQNFTRADDVVEDTINAASEWMAQWAMQFIKLRYTEEHFRKLLGSKGSFTFLKLKRDKIEDGMEVMIKSSATDKLKAQRNAMDAAKLGPPFVNPLDFFKDMEYSDPEGRTERGITLMADPTGITYLTKFVLGLKDVPAQAAALNGQPMPPQPGVPSQGQPPVPTPQPNIPPPPSPVANGAPMGSTPTDTTAIPGIQTIPQGSPRIL